MSDEKCVSDEYSWKILESYFKHNTLLNNQIESFDDFIHFGMQAIIDQENTITVPNYTVKFGQIQLTKPQIIEENRDVHLLYPNDARMRSLHYDASIELDITETFNDGKTTTSITHLRQSIGRMPILVGSSACNLYNLSDDEKLNKGECPNDYGGYFIVKGHERTVVAQMRSVYNQIIVLKKKPGERQSYVAETRSMSEETGHSVLLKAFLDSDNRSITFSVHHIKDLIPVGIVFKALGFKEEDIPKFLHLTHPNCENYLKYIIRDSSICKTQEEALKYIGARSLHTIPVEKRFDFARQIIELEMLPHLGISSFGISKENSALERAVFIGSMVRKLLYTAIGERQCDDRDHFMNKRVETVGPLMYEIFRNLFKKYIQTIKTQLIGKKQQPDIKSINSRIKIISEGLRRCLSTGTWSVQKNTYAKTGVSQVLDRMTYCASLSHLRRVVIPMGKNGRNTAIRQIQQSSWGFICPCESPEGKNVGVVSYFALLAKITKKVQPVEFKSLLEKISSISELDVKNINIPVFLNGVVIGQTENPKKTIQELTTMRINGIISKEISFVYDYVDNEVKIFCDEGRFSRPLIPVEDGNLRIFSIIEKNKNKSLHWGKLLEKNLIKYVDAFEMDYNTIAMTPDEINTETTLCEIHPCVMLGIMAGKIPFPDHSQAPRNCFSSSMMKQALGIPVMSYNTRADLLTHVLHYPQKPIVTTKIAEYTGIDKMPSGINAMVAVACWSTNQEDSVCLNASSIERGMFCLTTYHTLECSERKRNIYSKEEICLPPENNDKIETNHPSYFRRKNANYMLLRENGIIREKHDDGSSVYVQKGDVLVGKVVVTGNKSGEEHRVDSSLIVQTGEEGYIDKVISTITPNGYKLVKIVLRNIRTPTLGDKMASRSGQKGTIGMVYPQEDLPWTVNGMIPDIIINACCLPSRMTINQLIECVLGKEAVISGEFRDATPFTQNSINVAEKLVKKIEDNIQEYGFQPHGWEKMYSGTTGEELKAKIFYGPTYYQRLKHMVFDKMHARARGSVTLLCRQPLEGVIVVYFVIIYGVN